MRKIILSALCAFLSLSSYAQGMSVVEKALVNCAKLRGKIARQVNVPLTGNVTFDIERATQAIKNAARLQSSSAIIKDLTQKAVKENRADIPEALLANEVLNKSALEFYNAGQDHGSLWYAYIPGIVENGQYRDLDRIYVGLRSEVEGYIKELKLELRLQTTSPVVLFNNEMDLQENWRPLKTYNIE